MCATPVVRSPARGAIGIEQRDPQFRVVWRSVRCNLECVFFGRHGIQNPRIAYLQKRRFHLVDRRRLFLRAADRLPVAIRPDNVHLVAIHPYSGQSCVQHSFVFRNERVQCGQLRAACANQRACQVKYRLFSAWIKDYMDFRPTIGWKPPPGASGPSTR